MNVSEFRLFVNKLVIMKNHPLVSISRTGAVIGRAKTYDAFELNRIFKVGRVTLFKYDIISGLRFRYKNDMGIWFECYKLGFYLTWR